MTRLLRIQLFEKKGEPGVACDCARVIDGHGLEGDRHCMKDRPISIVDQKLVDWVNVQTYDGLCFHRYKTNLVFDDYCELKLEEDSKLAIGQQVTLRMEGPLKKCYEDECELYRMGVKCILPENMLFATCSKGGEIRIGDEVTN